MSSDVLTCEEQEAFTLNWKLKKIVDFLHINSEVELSGVNNL